MGSVKTATIPFNKPFVDLRVLEYVRQVLESGIMSGDGPMCKAVERRMRELFGVRHALLTTSCTHALEIGMMMLDLEPGDEVITPSFTFVSAANAIISGGGKPVFCEITDRTLTIDPADFERRITKRTRAVIPVHYGGVAAEMDDVLAIAKAHGLYVLEDAAQGVSARYRGKYLGTIGDAGTFSFHDTKNYVSGEGGAFVTNNEDFARRAEIIREKGTNRANFLRGEVDKYTWVDHGSSYVLSDMLAAVLKWQMDILGEIHSRRRQVHDMYAAGLRDLEQAERLRLPLIPDHCESNYHIFYVLLRSEDERNSLLRGLKEQGIGATFHYVPLHSSPYARKMLGTADLRLPVTDRVSGTLLRLPIYPHLDNADVEYVIDTVHRLLD